MLLEGSCGYENHYFSFSGGEVEFYEDGSKNKEISGAYKLLDEDNAILQEHIMSFYFECDEKSGLTIFFRMEWGAEFLLLRNSHRLNIACHFDSESRFQIDTGEILGGFPRCRRVFGPLVVINPANHQLESAAN